ncbi:hypothetical protein F750_0468 [Streptomyces sp. PAMC 26508]|nr:hypothetical protein F750_0468 [Streptomyces sp. PAMC 26508]
MHSTFSSKGDSGTAMVSAYRAAPGRPGSSIDVPGVPQDVDA